MKSKDQKLETVDLATINPRQLPQLVGMFDAQKEIVKNNPYVAITDSKTYVTAKQNRTALVSGRTSIQNQDKVIATTIKEFRSKTAAITKELIDITLPHETKQQEEVKRYEAVKDKEKKEKEELKQRLIKVINDAIDLAIEGGEKIIEELTFDKIDSCPLESQLDKLDIEKFGEFKGSFLVKKGRLIGKLETKIGQLKIAETNRIESERLEKEKADFAKQQAEAKAKQDAIDLKNKETADANKKESDRLAKIESDRIAKIEAEAKVRSDAEAKVKQDAIDLEAKKKADAKLKKDQEAEAKRIEALKPDKEQLKQSIDSINISYLIVDLKDEKSIVFNELIQAEIEVLQLSLTNSLEALK